MPCWTLRLLGEMAIEGPAGARPLRLGRKGRALLAVIGAHGAPGVARERLLAMLWDDEPLRDAHGALRQCLHQVRAELGEAAEILASEGERIVLRESSCTVDVRRFEQLAAGDDLVTLREAADCYRGDLAEGLDAGVEWAQWSEVERARLRDLAHGVVARLGERAADAAALEQAARLACRLLASDPLHEGTTRALMQLYARAGLRSKALQVWGECRRALRRELGVEPSEPTAALAAALAVPGAPPAAVAGAGRDARAWTVQAVPPGSPLHASDDPQVLDLMLRGWELFATYTAEGHAQARRVYEQVIALVPRHTEALTLLGWTHWFDAIAGRSADAEASFDRAEGLAHQALACGHGSATPHGLMGKVLLWRMRHAEAREHLQQAVQLAPGYAYMHFHLGDLAAWSACPDEALGHIDRALRLDPNDHGVFLTVRGLALWMTGDAAAARAALESALRRNPSYPWAHSILAVVLHEAGDLAAARRSAQTARRFNRRLSVDYAERVLPFLDPGHRARYVLAWRTAGLPEHEAVAVPAG